MATSVMRGKLITPARARIVHAYKKRHDWLRFGPRHISMTSTGFYGWPEKQREDFITWEKEFLATPTWRGQTAPR